MTEIIADRSGIGYGWDVGESGWKPGVDKNFQALDTLMGLWVISDALTSPPVSPSGGDTYIVATGGSGAWGGHEAQVAAYMNGAWTFFPVALGLRAWFVNHGEFRDWNGSAWVSEVTSRNKGAMMAQWVSGAIVANGTIYFAFKAPYAGTINSLDYVTGNGSFDVNIEINGTGVTSLTAVAVSSSTPANTAATGADTFSAGDTISGVISSATSAPTDAILNLNVTWSSTTNDTSDDLPAALQASGVTANTAFPTALPANGVILYAVLQETAGVAVNVSIGSTSGGADVMPAWPVPANGVTVVPVDEFLDVWFSATVPETLYVNSSSWGGASINCTLVNRKA